jgi:hypothetical protein
MGNVAQSFPPRRLSEANNNRHEHSWESLESVKLLLARLGGLVHRRR